MKVEVESSTLLKPSYKDADSPPSILQTIPLTVFDKVASDVHLAIVYVFRPPVPPNSHLVGSLAEVLSEYREWAGRFAEDAAGNPVILLNDAGIGLVEASVDSPLISLLPLKPSPELRCLHPSTDGDVEELALAQLTRFACGSLAIGFSMHRRVADGHAASSFLVAWGLACRGLPFPVPKRNLIAAFVMPRNPPEIAFEHRGTEYTPKEPCLKISKGHVTMLKAHFTSKFLTELKSKAASGGDRSYTRFAVLVAHLWRVVTKARGLGERETTELWISVNGRWRMSPRISANNFGNLVLWARPRARVGRLVSEPLQHAAELVHRGVAMYDDEYFRSFIDFASSGAVEKERLVPKTYEKLPDMNVDSWLRLPFYDLDFGGGTPFLFMPSYEAVEGKVLLLPSFMGDGSIDAYVTVFKENAASFKEWCYSLD